MSKGVRKLREKDAKEGKEIVLVKAIKDEEEEVIQSEREQGRGESYAMDDIQSVSAHLLPNEEGPSTRARPTADRPALTLPMNRSTPITSTLTAPLSLG